MIENVDELILECNTKKLIFENDRSIANLSDLHKSVNKLINYINKIYLNDNDNLFEHIPRP